MAATTDHDPTRGVTKRDLEAILDTLAEGIVTVTDQGQVMGINRAACEILEVDRKAAMGTSCQTLFGEQFCGQAGTVRESLRCGQPVENVHARLRTPAGRERVLNLRTSVLRQSPDGPQASAVVFRDVTELVHLREDLARRYQLHNLVGKSKPMQEIFRLVEEVADSEASVLLEGESGTGKELVARAIHHLSPRSDGPLVAVNCSALAEGVLESELFGHVEGSFTGASRDKRGRFEAAAGGTIFLDEIGDLAPAIQVKLLRVLQERTVERVGSEEPIAVDIRVIAATHRPLAEMVADDRFRQDLYYRLRVVPIQLPPLRARRDDVPLLARHFIDRFREETGRPIEGFDPGALALLLDYPWPGNVRELENAVEYAFVKCRGGNITADHLPPELTGRAAIARPFPATEMPAAGEVLPPRGRATPLAIRQALEATGWNIARAARHLGISRTTLYKRITELRLERPSE